MAEVTIKPISEMASQGVIAAGDVFLAETAAGNPKPVPAGALASLDQIESANIAAGAFLPVHMYAASGLVPDADGSGISEVETYTDGVNFLVLLDSGTTEVRMTPPPSRRLLYLYNASGGSIDLKNSDGTVTIRAGVPNRHVVLFSNNGAGDGASNWAFFVEFSTRLHTHTVSEVPGALAKTGDTLTDVKITQTAVPGALTVTSAHSGQSLVYSGNGHTFTFTGSGLGAGCHGTIHNLGSGTITVATDLTEKFTGTEPIPVDATATWEATATHLIMSVNA